MGRGLLKRNAAVPTAARPAPATAGRSAVRLEILLAKRHRIAVDGCDHDRMDGLNRACPACNALDNSPSEAAVHGTVLERHSAHL